MIGDDEDKTLEVLNPPQLHLMTGVLGKLIMEMEKITGEIFVSSFLSTKDISRCVYQGSRSFEGNQARKLLKSVDKLEREVMKLKTETCIEVLPYIETLRSFDRVVSSCFSQSLDPGYERNIETFSTKYRSLGISVTPKVHIVESHVSEFLKLKGEIAGLGFWSEQAMEAGHHDFKIEWEKVKVSANHAEYGERMFQTVVRYAGKHLKL